MSRYGAVLGWSRPLPSLQHRNSEISRSNLRGDETGNPNGASNSSADAGFQASARIARHHRWTRESVAEETGSGYAYGKHISRRTCSHCRCSWSRAGRGCKRRPPIAPTLCHLCAADCSRHLPFADRFGSEESSRYLSHRQEWHCCRARIVGAAAELWPRLWLRVPRSKFHHAGHAIPLHSGDLRSA